jgi:hypothetical protein
MLFRHYLKLVIFIFALWGYPFFASWVINPEYSQLITIPYRAAITLGTLIFVFISAQNFKVFEKKLLFYILISFVTLYSFRILNDTLDSNISLSKPSGTFLLLWFLVSIFPSLIFVLTDYKPENGKLYLIFSLIICFSSLVQFLYQIGSLSSYLNSSSRLSLAAINSISIGHTSASTIILSLYCLLKSKLFGKSVANSLLHIFLYATLGTGLYFLFFAASRGPLLATIFCLSLFIIVKRILNRSSLLKYLKFDLARIKLKYFFLILFIIICLSLVSQKLSLEGVNLERLMSYDDDYEIGDAWSRNKLISLAFSSVLQDNNLLAGFGLELPNGRAYPHNLLVESLLTTGIIGALIFMVLLIGCILKSIKILIKSDSWGWLALIYLQYAVGGMFSGSLYAFSTFWYLTFAIVCFPVKNHHKKKVNKTLTGSNTFSLPTIK